MKNKLETFAMNAVIILLLLNSLFLTALCWFGGTGGIKDTFLSIKSYMGYNLDGKNDDAEIYEYTEYAFSLDELAPLRGAVRTREGLAGATDRESARQLFERMNNVLTYAFDTAVMDRELSVREWREYLGGEMVFFDFEGSVPLYALAAYFGTGRFDTLYLEPRYMMLVPREEGLLLCVKTEDDRMYAYTTSVKIGLEGVEEIYPPDGSMFGMESEYSRKLPAEVIIAKKRGTVYALRENAMIMDFAGTGAERMVNSVLEALNFNKYSTGSYIESDTTHVYVENLNTLRIHPDGSINYNAGTMENVSGIPSCEDKAVMLSSALETARRIMSEGLGAADIYIRRTYTKGGDFVVLLGCECGGVRIDNENGYCARFVFRGSKLAEAQIKLAQYDLTDTAEVLIPDIQAAALAAENGRLSEFELKYSRGGDEWRCGWFFD